MNPPVRSPPNETWQHYHLWNRVKNSIGHLDSTFRSTITVSGINATEIYAFGEVLGLTIEEEVVRNLNMLRDRWDDGMYGKYKFMRQAQTFQT